MMAKWRDIPGWEGLYQISDEGVVKRVDGKARKRGDKDGTLRTKPHSKGYRMVALQEKPRREYWLVHRLVMLAFKGPAPKGWEVNHINGNKADNRLANLEYVTSSENKLHSARTLGNNTGKSNGNAKLSPKHIEEIRALSLTGVTGRQLAIQYGVSPSQISRIKNKHQWKGNPAAEPWREEFPDIESVEQRRLL